jgi:hypothetical protein
MAEDEVEIAGVLEGALAAAHAAWRLECARVEQLRLKYAPDMPSWEPAKPNTPPVPRPSWLASALASESKIRDREACSRRGRTAPG